MGNNQHALSQASQENSLPSQGKIAKLLALALLQLCGNQAPLRGKERSHHRPARTKAPQLPSLLP